MRKKQVRRLSIRAMMSILAIALCLVVSGQLAAEEANPAAPADVQPPEGFLEVGGSNYVMFRVDPVYREENQPGSWFRPGVLQPVVGTFHQQDRKLVLGQLRAMHEAGQRKIALFLWYEHTKPGEGVDNVRGHMVSSNGGTLCAQHRENLHNLISLICETGYFNEIIFRFAPQFHVSPITWTQWEPELYEENARMIASTREIVREAIGDRPVKVLFDLGAELGGIDLGQTQEFLRRIWQQYTLAYGTEDTCGFSYATHPGRLQSMLKIYQEVGAMPAVHAFDIYHHTEWLASALEEFRAAGIEQPKFMILETFYNDPKVLADLQQVFRDYQVQAQCLLQWPIEREKHYWEPEHKPRHFSVDFPPEYDAYLKKP